MNVRMGRRSSIKLVSDKDPRQRGFLLAQIYFSEKILSSLSTFFTVMVPRWSVRNI